ncbi:HNH endonuclease [Nocardioides mangrovicus]|uniref:HNH endonuclease n=1 Tax=Nocardioides mangrovicus TaxID=2478913 RepID=A0A3L8P5T0_9ACTN|nr:HNH endonuclease signature motif containing protein [Nocardioides mangrovicus]RLV50019.1 HNH endonuclease [Nocardioides mangrovicus]
MSSPLLTLLQRVDAALDAHGSTPVFGLDEEELAEAMVLAHRVATRVAHTELRLAAQAATGDVDVKTAWVRGTQQTPRATAARLSLAAALDAREPLRVAMAGGEVSEAQARVVVAALDRLPTDLGPDVLAAAQTHLIGLCADHHPDELRRLGRHLLRVVAPDVAEALEAKAVDAEYRRALERTRLEVRDRGDGSVEGRFLLPAAHGHMLTKLVTAYGSPKHRRAVEGAGISHRESPQRQGRAFCELLERMSADHVPHSGGVTARVVVDLRLDDLTARLTEHGVATLDGMVELPAWEARRMACEAGIIPAVLGSKSETLDLGRSARFHSPALRLIIMRRDKTCRAQGCDWPAWMGHIHHPIPWIRGGRTDLSGMALCPHHHARAHDPTYEMSTGKNGKVIFRRREERGRVDRNRDTRGGTPHPSQPIQISFNAASSKGGRS